MVTNVVNVSYGTFQIIDAQNSKGHGVYVKTLDGVSVLALPNAYWWDKDTIVNELEKQKENVIKTEKEKRKM